VAAANWESGVTYWADEVAAEAEGPQVVNDSKTPSGTIHVGSLRGVVLHDAIWRAVRQRGLDVTFRYGVEDLDPMDAQSQLTKDVVERCMGVPLAQVPAPDDSPHPNYARHFASLFLETFAGLGIRPEIYWMSELYGSGQLDPYVARALDQSETILDIYATVSTVRHPPDWLPIEVICENCGRIGTTHATGWDGTEVSYECMPDKVAWAKGCGSKGRASPFGGRAKLVWNVEWAARWSLFGVTIEGCGKDLATAGGSRDRADAISRRVFGREPPRNIPYEFVNIGGKKMSTSKGEGAAAHRIADLLPPDLLRFLFLRHRPNRALEFDPGGETIPRLFDDFDRVAAAVAGRPVKGELPPDPDRIFAMSLVDPEADPVREASRFRPPFAHLAMLLQIPGVDVIKLMTAEKGGTLEEVERRILEERIRVAEAWLTEFAPERYRIAVRREDLPPETAELNEEERDYLAALASAVAQAEPSTGEGWQQLLFELAHGRELAIADAFKAVYLAFLGRPNGPRAGWLLASLDTEFAMSRLRDAALVPPDAATGEAGKNL
jgi:lysyl-tRNA synthetase, class I